MADDGFNGATIKLDSVDIGPLRSIATNVVAPEAVTTASSDSDATSAGGVPKTTVSCEVVGGVSVAVNDTGALAIAWGDIGSSTLGTIATARVSSVSTQGNMDGEITSTVEFVFAAPTS